MLKISTIEIKNFKSIKNYVFEAEKVNIENTSAAILVGLNESGKSTFLEAISYISDGFELLDYETFCNIDSQENDEYIDLYVVYKIDNDKLFKTKLSELGSIESSVVQKLNIESITCNFYKNDKDGADKIFSVIIGDIDYKDLIIRQNKKTINGIQKVFKTIDRIKNGNEEDEDEDEEKLIKLDKKQFEEFLGNEIEKVISSYIPKIQLWKPSPEFLINNTINLQEFKENPKVSIPLRNIFNIYGRKTNVSIKESIEKALKTPAKRDKLQDELSDSITKHVNKVWKEHKIKIKISINQTECNVLIEDRDKKYSYFNMQQRSDGFKQFISLILSLSTLNEAQSLKNNIILIDEPEVHLHPSGIVYMRDELLKIAKNNLVIISTHSQFMIDTENPSRQFIVTKEKGESIIKQVDENTNFKEDSVLKSAFGLNLFKELLPDKILIVEGGDDKHLINHCLFLISNLRNFTIKSAGGASKMPGFASLFSGEDLSPIILFDSDKEGKDNKKKILDNHKDFYNKDNVFILKDILTSLPENSTIEDLYPKNFIIKLLKAEFEQDFDLNDSEPVISQIKNQNDKVRNDKQKLESLKIKLSNEFVKEYDTAEKLNNNANLSNFIVELTKKLES